TLTGDNATCSGQCTFENQREPIRAKPTPITFLSNPFKPLKGPGQRTICSLGSLEPAPAEDWLALAHKLQSALAGDTKPGRSAHVVTKKIVSYRKQSLRPRKPWKLG